MDECAFVRRHSRSSERGADTATDSAADSAAQAQPANRLHSQLPSQLPNQLPETCCDRCGAPLDGRGVCRNVAVFGGKFHDQNPPAAGRREEGHFAAEIAGETQGLIGRLLFASRDLARAQIHFGLVWQGEASRLRQRCEECQAELADAGDQAPAARMPHAESCRVGRVLNVLERIYGAANQPISRKEDAPSDFGGTEGLAGERGGGGAGEPSAADDDAALKRVRAALDFCDGIPTEVLERELPLASDRRQRWHEIQHLSAALPFIAEIRAKAAGLRVQR